MSTAAGKGTFLSIRFHITTMGCPKNVVDSENMTRLLEQAGHEEAIEQQADIVIVNTCGFIDAAKKESLGAIHDALRRKRPNQALIAAGCLVQRYQNELVQQISGLDDVLGTQHCDQIVAVVERVAQHRQISHRDRLPDAARPAREQRVSAYVKIADGCDRPCAFCAIPLIKGGYASRPVADVLADARRLATEGVKEIVFVAQETSAYGHDRGERDGLARLMSELAAAAPDVPWLRFLYAYPTTVTPRLIETWASLPQVVRYLDMPLQHAHPDVLRRMQRPHDIEHTRRVLAGLRSALPDIALRTTFIVGYPGETAAEFRAMLDFMSDVRFDNVGVFTYSAEEGTAAAAMPGQVPERIKRERYRQAMLHQQSISLTRNREWVGKTLQVLVEGQAEQQGDGAATAEPLVVGRSYRSAPEIDGLVFARGQAAPGDMVQVRITEATEYDLWGRIHGHRT